MATYTTSTSIGQREDLKNVISRIDPAETPLVSNAKMETTKAVNHEWLVQELAAAVDTNFVNEGADYSYVNPTVVTRLGNQHQISVQAMKALEQRRDIDKSLFKNEAKSSSDPRKAGKFLSYITNMELISASTTPAGTGANVSDMAGTNAALTLAKIDSAMKKAYEDGGNPTMMVVSPANKVAFSDLSSGSAVTNQLHMTSNAPTDAIIIGSVSMYLTDFGTLNVVIDRQASNSEILLLDKDHYSIGHLPGRMYSVRDIAPTGDTQKAAIVSEWTLIMSAPKAHAAVVDLSTT